MSIKRLTVEGLRGFSKKLNINFAIPDKKNIGSGLTVLVGPNNSGKSTIIEAIHFLTSNVNIIPNTIRNVKNNGEILLEAEDTLGNCITINSTLKGGAFVEKKCNGEKYEYYDGKLNTFILSSKRGFSSTFPNNSYQNRNNYRGNTNESDYRSENNINNNFGGRLINVYNNINEFNSCLEKVLSPLPKWTIEASDNNNMFLEFSFDEIKHSSKGAGDGYINIFNIVDSLYDSTENNVILIDEPEISLHPDLQRKLFKLLIEYSKDKQIIICTHSPYFVDWELFSNYSKIIRLKKEKSVISAYELTQKTKDEIKSLICDAHNPHILSLSANEIFFLNDNVILTEGQDDVLCYKRIFHRYNCILNASFFGWGAGGADKVDIILDILNDLGYKKVFIILDNDKKKKIEGILQKFPNYQCYAIAANDVRNKEMDKKAKKLIKQINKMNIKEDQKMSLIELIEQEFHQIEGLVNNLRNYEINSKYSEDVKSLISCLTKYFEEKKDSFNKLENTISDETITYRDESKAKQLLEKYIEDSKLYNLISDKYNYLEFHSGDSMELSFKKIMNNVYYVIIEQQESLSSDQEIIIQHHLVIDTNKEKVELKKQDIIKDTLPDMYIK